MKRTRRRRQLRIALPFLLALLPGCRQRQPGGGSAATATGAGAAAGAASVERDACSLLTQDDAESQLGGRVKQLLGGPARQSGALSGSSSPAATSTAIRPERSGAISTRCGYATESTNPLKVVGLLAQQFPDAAAAAGAYDRAHAVSRAISGMPPEDIAGLGDRAYWAGGTLKQLNVLKDNLWLNLNVTVGPGLDQQAPAREAMQKVLKHL